MIGQFPEAVVVDTRDGYVWCKDSHGALFTMQTALDYARFCNEMSRHKTYRVAPLRMLPKSATNAQ